VAGALIPPDDTIRADIKAAQTVFTSGIRLLVIPIDLASDLKLDKAALEQVLAPGTPPIQQVQALYQLWNQPLPPLADPYVGVELLPTPGH
jgi:inosine-uridine nucleoside N-ribohydrolase